jgi:hypothetical protein
MYTAKCAYTSEGWEVALGDMKSSSVFHQINWLKACKAVPWNSAMLLLAWFPKVVHHISA